MNFRAAGFDSTRVNHLFLGALGVGLIGYAFLDRAFAYLGHAPVYISEVLLAGAVVAAAVNLRRARFRIEHILLFLFMGWGAVRTLPFIGEYGLASLRDGVLWGYGFFAVAVSWTLTSQHFGALVTWYRRLIPVFLCWVPVAAVFLVHRQFVVSTVGLVKPGDLAVHMAGIAAFALVGLQVARGRSRLLANSALLALWVVGASLLVILTRGGLIAIALAIGSAFMLRPSVRWLAVFGAALLLVLVVGLIHPNVSLGYRQVSISQLETNVASIVTNVGDPKLQGTKSFRVKWWGKIISYTIRGPYFWTGKGFGINLADSDGFQEGTDHSLRAPHDSHMDVLARTGVPGLALWVALQIAFGANLLVAAFRARHKQAVNGVDWAKIDIWIFAYWLAMLANSSFDVYFEGPPGGIWFWSAIGAGLAALALQKGERARTLAMMHAEAAVG